MRKFVESFIDDVKVIAIFFLLFAAVYCGTEVISLIDFSSKEEEVKVVSKEEAFMQECMKRMESSSSHLQYHYGICNKELERKNK